MAVHEEQLKIPAPIDRLFEFLMRPANIALVSDPSSGLQIVDAPEIVQVGSIITFRIAAFGQVREATHQVIEFEPHSRIAEVQTAGPMKAWRHTHTFESDGDETILIERIDFEPPGGIVGLLVTADKIIDQLADAMYYKEQALRKLAAQGRL
jgi:ligand-binding SRPBCC domain-containing protein